MPHGVAPPRVIENTLQSRREAARLRNVWADGFTGAKSLGLGISRGPLSIVPSAVIQIAHPQHPGDDMQLRLRGDAAEVAFYNGWETAQTHLWSTSGLRFRGVRKVVPLSTGARDGAALLWLAGAWSGAVVAFVRGGCVTVFHIDSPDARVVYKYASTTNYGSSFQAALITTSKAYFLTDTGSGNPVGSISTLSCTKDVQALLAQKTDMDTLRARMARGQPCVKVAKPLLLLTTRESTDPNEHGSAAMQAVLHK